MLRSTYCGIFISGTSCRGREDVYEVLLANRVWCIDWIEEGKSQLIKGVVGGAAGRRNLTGKGLWSGQRIKEGAWEKDDGRSCISQ